MIDALTIHREVVTRDEISFILGIPEAEMTLWLSPEADADYQAGRSPIPQIPHYPGKPARFDIAAVRAWRRKYFQRGGEPTTEPAARSSKGRAVS